MFRTPLDQTEPPLTMTVLKEATLPRLKAPLMRCPAWVSKIDAPTLPLLYPRIPESSSQVPPLLITTEPLPCIPIQAPPVLVLTSTVLLPAMRSVPVPPVL